MDALDNIHQEEYTESAYHVSLRSPHGPISNTFIRLAEDLTGLKVSHDLDALEDGEDRILTLKDSRILDNEGTSQMTYNTSRLDTKLLSRGRVAEC